MNWVKGVLSTIAAVSLALILPTLIGLASGFKAISEEHATGVGLVLGGFIKQVYSAQFWVLAVLVFAFFFGASRLNNKVLRMLLFWLPASLSGLLGLMLAAFFFAGFVASRGR